MSLAILAVLFTVALAAESTAQITNHTWNSALTGPQQWQVNGNWTPATFPNAGNLGAIVSVGSDLTLDVGPSNVAVALLTLEGTTAGTDINLSSSSGMLVFRNDDDNTFTDPSSDPDVENILNHEGVNHGRVFVTSNGVAGTSNTISAPIRMENNGFLEGVDFFGTRSITLSGTIEIVGTAPEHNPNFRSYLPTDARVTFTGTINTTDVGTPADTRFLVLNNYYTSDHAEPPRGIIDVSGPIVGAGGLIVGWTWDVDGLEDGTDDALYDPADPPAAPLGTVILRGNNTFTEDVLHGRGNLVLDHNNALGTDNTFRQAGQAGSSKEVGYNVISTSDDRVIPNNVSLAQWTTVKGASGIAGLEDVGDHSITFSGTVVTSNTRGWVNLLPAGKTLTLSGPQYPLEGGDNHDTDRIYTVDGTGKTVITSGIYNRHPDNDGDTGPDRGHFRIRGSSVVYIDWDNNQQMIPNPNDPQGPMIPDPEDRYSDFSGYSWVQGGNLHFGEVGDLGEGEVLSSAGAIGVDSGVLNNSALLQKLRNSSNPNITGLENFFLIYDTNSSIFTKHSQGGLMLGTNEYGQSLNFTTGDLANAANMTLAAHETGSEYTGTITPSSTVPINPNTYQLGGGSGVLTLPNAQLGNGTGTRHLLVTNGGEVRLEGANTYTGVTKVVAKYRESLKDYAQVDSADPDLDGRYGETTLVTKISSTLTATKLENGGAPSSIGASTNAASNVILQDGTLKYAGSTPSSTDRLFTVGTGGATLDASGATTNDKVVFSNTGALAIDVAEERMGILSQSVVGDNNNIIFGLPGEAQLPFPVPFNTDDLVPGMRIFTPDSNAFTPPAGGSAIRITNIPAAEVILVGQPNLLPSEEDFDGNSLPNRWTGYSEAGDLRTIQFGAAPARFLTLKGNNAGDNTLAPSIGNAPAATLALSAEEIAEGYGTVGIHKTGGGKWILTNNNTYSGATKVDEGTLLINGMQTGTGLTTVASGARFGGTGQIGGGLTMLEGSIFTATAAGGTLDPLNVVGNVDLAALANALDVTGITSGTHTLLTYAGTLTGTFESTPGFSVNYGTLSNSAITITKIADILIGDYNGNGKVDAADYTIWRNNVNNPGSTLGPNRDPANGTGLVSMADYNSWKSNFGAQLGAGALGVGSVPEPTSFALLAFALTAVGCLRRRPA